MTGREKGVSSLTDGVDRLSWAVMPADRMPRVAERLEWRRLLGWGPPFVPHHAEERADPSAVLPGARSVVAVAAPYWHPRERDDEAGAIVSRSTWGRDYHEVLPPLIHRLLARLAGENAASRAHIQVDSGPLEERAVAVRAGLGYQGANGSVYVPPYGSWVFLGAAVTDVCLPPRVNPGMTGPARDCSECARCVSACPTKALFAPYRVNPHRCLSYLTQKRGFVPVAMRRAMGSRLYGCDTCQQACCQNRDPGEGLKAFLPDAVDSEPDPAGLLQMSNRQFVDTWGSKAAGWRGRRTLQRNALIVLANTGDYRDLPLLQRMLDDARPVIRGFAAWALGEILRREGAQDHGGIQEALATLAEVDGSEEVRRESRRALQDL